MEPDSHRNGGDSHEGGRALGARKTCLEDLLGRSAVGGPARPQPHVHKGQLNICNSQL